MHRAALMGLAMMVAAPAFANAFPAYNTFAQSTWKRDYLVIKDANLTLDEAFQACDGLGYMLADVEDPEEEAFLSHALDAVRGNASWLSYASTSVTDARAIPGDGYSLDDFVRVTSGQDRLDLICERPRAMP